MYTENELKSLRNQLKKYIEPLIDTHYAIKYNKDIFHTSTNAIVEDLIVSPQIQLIAQQVCRDISIIDNKDIEFNHELEDFISTSSLNVCLKGSLMKRTKFLRDMLLSKDKQLFQDSFITHYQLIKNPETMHEGIKNILKVLKISFLNSSKSYNSNVMRMNLKLNTHINLYRVVSLLLLALSRLTKINRHQHIKEIIIDLMDLISIPTLFRKFPKLHFICYAALVDPEASWFKKILCYGFSRTLILNYFEENKEVMKYFLIEISNNMYNDNECYLRNTIVDEKTELNVASMKMITMINYLYMISYLLNYSKSLFVTDLTFNNKKLTVSSYIQYLLDVVNDFSDDKSQAPKYNVCIAILKELLVSTCYLNDANLLDKFTQPLKLCEERNLYYAAKKYLYLYETCVGISKMENGFALLYRFNDSKKDKKSFSNLQENSMLDKYVKFYLTNKTDSVADTLINFTTSLLSYCLSNGKKHKVLTINILNYCIDILTCEQHILFWYNCEQLILNTVNLYIYLIDELENYPANGLHLNKVEKALYAFSLSPVTINMIEKKSLLIFGQRYLSLNVKFWETKHFSTFLFNFCEFGGEAILEKKDYLVLPLLYKIYALQEDEFILLSGSERKKEKRIFNFLKLIFSIASSFKCCEIMFSDNISAKNDVYPPQNLAGLINTLFKSVSTDNISFVALSAIQILMKNLSILLFLETKFNLIENLVKQHNECIIDETKYIMDECSIIRYDILHFMYDIGMEVPRNIIIIPKKSSHTKLVRKYLNELQRFLLATKNNLHDYSWMLKLRKVHKVSLEVNLKESVICLILCNLKTSFVVNTTQNCIKRNWPELSLELKILNCEELIGISSIVRFGIRHKLLYPNCQNKELLSILLKQSKIYTDTLSDNFEGFDWFVGIIFLICNANLDKCRNILSIITKIPSGAFIWKALRTSEHNRQIQLMLHQVLRDLEIISICEIAGINITGLFYLFLDNCYFGMLPWSEICHWLLYALIYPPEYLIFYFVALIMHVKHFFTNLSLEDKLNPGNILKILRFEGFYLKDAINFIESLAKQHKHLTSYA